MYFNHYDTADFNVSRQLLVTRSKKALVHSDTTGMAITGPIRKRYKRRKVEVRMHYTGEMGADDDTGASTSG